MPDIEVRSLPLRLGWKKRLFLKQFGKPGNFTEPMKILLNRQNLELDHKSEGDYEDLLSHSIRQISFKERSLKPLFDQLMPDFKL